MPSNIVDYGTPQEPNLDEISKQADLLLQVYNDLLKNKGIGIYGFLKLERTLEKPYTARSVVDVITLNNATKVGDLYVILFAPADGTGKEGEYRLVQSDEDSTYSLQKEQPAGGSLVDEALVSTVEVPLEYQVPKREGVIPRNKKGEGVLLEACFPLGTVEGKYHVSQLISLEQITFDQSRNPTSLTRGLQMGFDDSSYVNALQNLPTLPMAMVNIQSRASIYLTCGYRRNGERFGDPHATFYNPKLAQGHPNRMQVAAFLAVESAGNPLCKVFDEIGIVPEQKR